MTRYECPKCARRIEVLGPYIPECNCGAKSLRSVLMKPTNNAPRRGRKKVSA